jgi:hypothetical protein
MILTFRRTLLPPGEEFGKYIIHISQLGYGLDDRVFESRQGLGIFLFITESRQALGPIQPIQWIAGALFPGSEAEHSPASSAEVKNAWSYTSTPPILLHGVVLSSRKAQGQHYLFYIHIILVDLPLGSTPL